MACIEDLRARYAGPAAGEHELRRGENEAASSTIIPVDVSPPSAALALALARRGSLASVLRLVRSATELDRVVPTLFRGNALALTQGIKVLLFVPRQLP
jgi:hypothetical protein